MAGQGGQGPPAVPGEPPAAETLLPEGFEPPAVANVPLPFSPWRAQPTFSSIVPVPFTLAVADVPVPVTLGQPTFWSAKRPAVGEAAQLDVGSEHIILGVVVQGNPRSDEWVTKFEVSCSVQGEIWSYVPGNFDGNFDRSTWVIVRFPAPVQARYLRLVVLGWHDHPVWRVGVILAGAVTESPPVANEGRERPLSASCLISGSYQARPLSASCSTTMIGSHSHPLVRSGSEVRTPRSYQAGSWRSRPWQERGVGTWKSWRRDSEKIWPLEWNPQEGSRTYSTAQGLPDSQLGSGSGWQAGRARSGEYLQIDLGLEMDVIGSVVQGYLGSDKWVTEYEVRYGRKGKDGQTEWHRVPKSFQGSLDTDTKISATFPLAIKARYVQLCVLKYHVHPAMRACAIVLVGKSEYSRSMSGQVAPLVARAPAPASPGQPGTRTNPRERPGASPRTPQNPRRSPYASPVHHVRSVSPMFRGAP